MGENTINKLMKGSIDRMIQCTLTSEKGEVFNIIQMDNPSYREGHLNIDRQKELLPTFVKFQGTTGYDYVGDYFIGASLDNSGGIMTYNNESPYKHMRKTDNLNYAKSLITKGTTGVYLYSDVLIKAAPTGERQHLYIYPYKNEDVSFQIPKVEDGGICAYDTYCDENLLDCSFVIDSNGVLTHAILDRLRILPDDISLVIYRNLLTSKLEMVVADKIEYKDVDTLNVYVKDGQVRVELVTGGEVITEYFGNGKPVFLSSSNEEPIQSFLLDSFRGVEVYEDGSVYLTLDSRMKYLGKCENPHQIIDFFVDSEDGRYVTINGIPVPLTMEEYSKPVEYNKPKYQVKALGYIDVAYYDDGMVSVTRDGVRTYIGKLNNFDPNDMGLSIMNETDYVGFFLGTKLVKVSKEDWTIL